MAGRRRNNAEVDWRHRARTQMQRPGERRRPGPAATGDVSASNELAQRSLPAPPREALILATLINHPWLLDQEAEMVSGLTFTSQPLARLRDALLAAVSDENDLDTHSLSTQLDEQGLAKVVALVQRAITHKGDKFADPEADRAIVEVGWRHTVALHQKQVELRLALSAAEQAWHDEGSEDAFARICEIQALLNRTDGAEAPPALLT
jgi:DNA primase